VRGSAGTGHRRGDLLADNSRFSHAQNHDFTFALREQIDDALDGCRIEPGRRLRDSV